MHGKIVSALLIILMVSGCTSMKPVEMSPDQVQQKIAAGEVLGVGDKVKIATSDDQIHKFKVTEVTDQKVRGDGIEVPIDEIVAVETKKFSLGKTAALTSGTVVLWAFIVAAALGGTVAL